MDEPTPPTSTEYPVNFTVEYPETSSRILALTGILFMLKSLLLLPHLVILWILGILTGFLVFINYFIVLFTGQNNRFIFDFATGFLRWQVRISAWLYGLTDLYPPFNLER